MGDRQASPQTQRTQRPHQRLQEIPRSRKRSPIQPDHRWLQAQGMETTKHPPTPTKEVNAKKQAKLEIKEDLWKLKIGYLMFYQIFYLTISRYLKPYQTKILSFIVYVLRSVMTKLFVKNNKKTPSFSKKKKKKKKKS